MFSSTNNPLYFIGQGDWEVPDPNDVSNDEGLIALSWELSTEMYDRLYPSGIFPWFEQEGVVFWFSPEIRSITATDQVKISKSMRPYINGFEGDFFDTPMYEKLYEYFAFTTGEMPYGTAKARDADPDTWIIEHLAALPTEQELQWMEE